MASLGHLIARIVENAQSGSNEDTQREAVHEYNVKLREFNEGIANEEAVERLESAGVTAAGILWSMSVQASTISALRSLDIELAYAALRTLTKFEDCRNRLLLDDLRSTGTTCQSSLDILEIAVDSSVRLSEVIAENFIADLIRVIIDATLNDNLSRRLVDVIIKLIDHNEGSVALKASKAITNDDAALTEIKQWIFSNDDILSLSVQSVNKAADSTLKQRKHKNVEVERALRLAHLMLVLSYSCLRGGSEFPRMNELLDALWMLAKAGDPLTTLNVVELLEETLGNAVYRNQFVGSKNFAEQVHQCVVTSEPFQELVRPQCLRLMSKSLQCRNLKTDVIPDIKAADASREWKFYFTYLKYCLENQLPDGPDRDEMLILVFDCWGTACAGGNGFAIGMFEEYLPGARRLATKLIQSKGVNVNVILAILYAWNLVLTGSDLTKPVERLNREVKREGDEYFDHFLHFVLGPIIELCISRPFEELRVAIINTLTNSLCFQTAMEKMVHSKELMHLFRMPTTQPILVARYDWIKALLSLYTDKEVDAHIEPVAALKHFKEMRESCSYAFIAPEMRQGEVNVQTE